MTAPIMGPRRFTEALAAAGLQPSDSREVHPARRSAMWSALWVALENACDPRFVVILPTEPTTNDGQGGIQ
jgi:hypothetical protein